MQLITERRLLTRRDDENGLTLVELLVVMLIMGIVGSVVASGMIQGLQTSGRAQSRITALTDLQRGVERVARELRVANPLCLTTGLEDTHLGANVYRDGKRYRYEYYLSGAGAAQELLADITEFDPVDAATGTVLASGTFIAEIGNDLLGVPLFEYADQNGDPTTGYATAAQVTINLAKQVRDSDPILVSTTVEIRNTRYTGGGGAC